MTKYWDKRLRDKEIERLRAQGKKPGEIAALKGISVRTVRRVIKGLTKGKQSK